MLKDGLETIVTVDEFKLGSLGGLKPGDTRPFGLGGGKKPSTWDPKQPSGGGSGTNSGSPQSTGGASQNGSGSPASEGHPDPGAGDPSPTGGEPSASAEPESVKGSSGGGTKTEQQVIWTEPQTQENGNTYRGYEVKNADGSTERYGSQTEKPDGSKSCKDNTAGGEQDAECPAGGMTDEPTCSSSCDHLAVFVWLVGCTGTECSTLPAAASDHGCEATHTATDSEGRAGQGHGGSHSDSAGPMGAPGQGASGVSVADCAGAGKPGGPIDYGNPDDPNAPDPLDPSQFADPRDDGVTDPVDPGEGENGPAPVAIFDDGGTTPDLGNPLLDPVAPWVEVSGPSGDGPPRTGDADRIRNP